ncbi:MAG: hypothetical protein JW982_13430, partial [Spirochaetes bacterium]|nr:hypothetical protein [Spirochaetota bacterium]
YSGNILTIHCFFILKIHGNSIYFVAGVNTKNLLISVFFLTSSIGRKMTSMFFFWNSSGTGIDVGVFLYVDLIAFIKIPLDVFSCISGSVSEC